MQGPIHAQLIETTRKSCEARAIVLSVSHLEELHDTYSPFSVRRFSEECSKESTTSWQILKGPCTRDSSNDQASVKVEWEGGRPPECSVCGFH